MDDRQQFVLEAGPVYHLAKCLELLRGGRQVELYLAVLHGDRELRLVLSPLVFLALTEPDGQLLGSDGAYDDLDVERVLLEPESG